MMTFLFDAKNPTHNPQNDRSWTTSAYLGIPRGPLSRCKTDSRSAATAAFSSFEFRLTVGQSKAVYSWVTRRMLCACGGPFIVQADSTFYVFFEARSVVVEANQSLIEHRNALLCQSEMTESDLPGPA